MISTFMLLTLMIAVGASVYSDKCSDITRSCSGRCSSSFVSQEVKKNHKPCSCDPQCRYVFGDCCADFESVCPAQLLLKDTTHRKFSWRCRKIFADPIFANKTLYVVDKCMQSWPKGEISINCSTREAKSFHDILLAVPVWMKKSEVLFRNIYCAFCNGLKLEDVKFWEVKFSAETTKFADTKTALKDDLDLYNPFFMDKYVNISEIRLADNKLGVRICLNVVKSCNYTKNKALVEKCELGPAALISDGQKNFKNNACFACNYQFQKSIPHNLMCGPNYEDLGREKFPNYKYSLMFGEKLYSSFSTKNMCPKGYLFDQKNRQCLRTYRFSRFSSAYALRAHHIFIKYERKSLNTTECFAKNRSENENAFKDTFEKILFNQTNNTARLSTFTVIPVNDSYLVALRVVNTIQKQPGNFSNNSATYNTTQATLLQLNDDFISMFKIPIVIGQCHYIPKRVRSREMVCVENKTFPVDAQDVMGKTTIFLKETRKNYSQGEFWVFDEPNDTVVVTICDHFLPTNCSYYINETEESNWLLHANLSLFYKVTGTFFEYGAYSIKNDTVWFCLSEKHLSNQPTIRIEINDTIISVLTLVATIISLTSLFALIVIYSVFPALRNLPGKNLMLMSTVLAIAQLLWLLQDQISSIFSRRCGVTLIALHYFFLASFTSSGSIAYHSYKTFYSISHGRLQRTENKFAWYTLYSLGCPAVTVVALWFIDFYDVLNLDFNKTKALCWSSEDHSVQIAFSGTIFLQLFINLALFLATLKSIYKCSQSNLTAGEKNNGVKRQNIGIYIRMSTLMGLTWIFGGLLVTFPGEIVLDYFFNVVNGLQGLYIALAFLSTESVRKLLTVKAKFPREQSTMVASENSL